MEKKIITAREIFLDAKAAFSSDRKFIGTTALLGIFLPMVLLSFALDISGISAAQGVRDSFFESSSQGKQFAEYLAQILPYFSTVMFSSIIIFLVITACYCIIGARVSARARGLVFEGTFLQAILKAVPTSLALVVMLALSSLIAQIALFPAIFIICLGTMFPVLEFTEGRGAFKAVWHAITIRYTRGRAVSKWNVFFNLISIGAFCYTLFVLFAFLGDALLNADTYIALPRSIWYWNLPGTEIGLIYALVSMLENLMLSVVLVALCLLTNSLYFKTREQKIIAVV